MSKRKRRSLLAALSTLIAAALTYHTGAGRQLVGTAATHNPGLYRVTSVIDGDTITVAVGAGTETVRLIGVDTPETHDPRKPVQCFGEAAHQHTKELLSSGQVRLEADPRDNDRDKYHRLLRYVYVPDGTFVNAKLVEDGYAFAYTVFDNSQIDLFRQLEREARDNNRGLWAGCNVNDSKAIKQTEFKP